MGILNRFLLFLFTIVSIAAGCGLVAVLSRLVPERVWVDAVNLYAGWPETFVGLAIYLLVGFELLCSVFVRKKDGPSSRGEITLSSDLAGSVQVSAAAVKGVAERAARSIRGVRDVRSQLHVARGEQGESSLRLALSLVLGTEAPVKEVSDEVHAAVEQELSSLLGLAGVDVAIRVTDITTARLPHQPRVS